MILFYPYSSHLSHSWRSRSWQVFYYMLREKTGWWALICCQISKCRNFSKFPRSHSFIINRLGQHDIYRGHKNEFCTSIDSKSLIGWSLKVKWAIPENIHTPPMDDTELGTQKFEDFQEGQLWFLQDSRAYWFKILRNSRISLSWNSS